MHKYHRKQREAPRKPSESDSDSAHSTHSIPRKKKSIKATTTKSKEKRNQKKQEPTEHKHENREGGKDLLGKARRGKKQNPTKQKQQTSCSASDSSKPSEPSKRKSIPFHVWEWHDTNLRYLPTGTVVTSALVTRAANKVGKQGCRGFVLLDHQTHAKDQKIHASFFLAERGNVNKTVVIQGKTPFVQRHKVAIQKWHDQIVPRTEILDLLMRYRDPRAASVGTLDV